jgi:hypothetical protein
MGLAKLDKATVERIASKYYPHEADALVFSDGFRKPLVARGYLEMREFEEIARWKAKERVMHHIRSNRPQTVMACTHEAFGEPDPERAVSILDPLKGVNVRMASAILTVHDPDGHTILDVNAWMSLQKLGLVTPPKISLQWHLDKPATYADYLRVCKSLANELYVPMRVLDECLWVLKGRAPEELR